MVDKNATGFAKHIPRIKAWAVSKTLFLSRKRFQDLGQMSDALWQANGRMDDRSGERKSHAGKSFALLLTSAVLQTRRKTICTRGGQQEIPPSIF
ncbi:hypothetical protein M0804_003788 [Polistes exclamans]|nr:hypothetical protein M0804_003788 [Polistes exclamans]